MNNWKRIIAAAGTAALLISNMGSVTQAVFADNTDGWELIENSDSSGASTEGPAEDIDLQDLGDENDTPAVEATKDESPSDANTSTSEAAPPSTTDASASQSASTVSTMAPATEDTTPATSEATSPQKESAAGSDAESSAASENALSGAGEASDHNQQEQSASPEDATQSAQEPANNATANEIETPAADSTEDNTSDVIEDGGDVADGATEDETVDDSDHGEDENDPVIYELDDSLTVQLEMEESNEREDTRDENDNAYLYDLGEKSFTTVMLTNPEEYALDETDNAVVRVYMQFTDNEPDTEDVDLLPNQNDIAADTPIVEIEDDTYEYEAYEIEPDLYCYSFERPIDGDEYKVVISNAYGEDTDGGEARIWAVLLTAEDAAALDEKAAAKNQDASDDVDTDKEEQADTEEELDENTDDVDADDIIGVADPSEENELLTLRWCKDSNEDTEEEPNYPSFQYSEEMSDGTVIDVDAPEGAFPEGIRLALEIKDAEDYLDAIRAFTGDETLTAEGWLAYDFDFYTDKEHHNIEPETDIKVTFSNLSNVMELAEQMAAEEDTESADIMLADLADEDAANNNGDEGSPIEEASVTVYHIADAEDGQGEVTETTINNVDLEAGSVEIETDTFSTQVVYAASHWSGGGGGNRNSSVDHIDIGVTGTVNITVGGETYPVTVTLDRNDFTSNNVTITAEYQNGGSANFSPNWNNITTSSGSSGISQYRVGGTYPVGTKSNPVIYTFTLKKNVTVKIKGKQVTIPASLSSSFHYFQYDNDCPGIHNHENYYDGTVSNAAGMDFILSFEDKMVLVYKKVLDENGNLLKVNNYKAEFTIDKSVDGNGVAVDVDSTTGEGFAIEQVSSIDSVTIKESQPAQSVTVGGTTYTYVGTKINNVNGLTKTESNVSSFTVENIYRKPLNIQILKHKQGEEQTVLPGAQFTLTSGAGDELVYYKADGTTSTTEEILTTDSDGKIEIVGLGNGTYTLTEIQAPSGYNLLEDPITIVIDGTDVRYGSRTATKETVTVNGSSTEFYIVKVANEPGYELPETGGAGTLPFEVGGSAAILGAMCIGYSRRRRGRKEGEM